MNNETRVRVQARIPIGGREKGTVVMPGQLGWRDACHRIEFDKYPGELFRHMYEGQQYVLATEPPEPVVRVAALMDIVTPIKGAVVACGERGTLEGDDVRWDSMSFALCPGLAEGVDYTVIAEAPPPPVPPPAEYIAQIRERVLVADCATLKGLIDQCCAIAARGEDFGPTWEAVQRNSAWVLAELFRVKKLPR